MGVVHTGSAIFQEIEVRVASNQRNLTDIMKLD